MGEVSAMHAKARSAAQDLSRDRRFVPADFPAACFSNGAIGAG